MADADAAPVIAAIGWDETGFEVAVASAAEPGAVTLRRASDVADVHRQLLGLRDQFGERLSGIVDSTNGMLDGGLTSAGLTMYRADPASLPARPLLGSASAASIADAAARHPERLTRLVLQTGSLTGRFPEVNAAVNAAADRLGQLTAAGRSVKQGPSDTDRPTVAITFDDGPHPPYTERVLETLARYGVPATFFCVGLHARTHHELVCRIVDEGHQLGNHTWSHPLLGDLDRAQLSAQLDRTDVFLDAAGRTGRALFRPPYGAINPTFVEWFGSTATDRTMVLWDVEPFDWAAPGADAIARIVVDDVEPGSIVLLHDGGGDRSQTVDALPRIIEGLQERGFALVTVDGLLDPA